mmetsp:Transcript_1459/g.2877  ORF Transcript_1459/g.2877 Transcript_1459/m.2877 type:complete len:261 (-) Transcript_1459:70-852(-)
MTWLFMKVPPPLRLWFCATYEEVAVITVDCFASLDLETRGGDGGGNLVRGVGPVGALSLRLEDGLVLLGDFAALPENAKCAGQTVLALQAGEEVAAPVGDIHVAPQIDEVEPAARPQHTPHVAQALLGVRHRVERVNADQQISRARGGDILQREGFVFHIVEFRQLGARGRVHADVGFDQVNFAIGTGAGRDLGVIAGAAANVVNQPWRLDRAEECLEVLQKLLIRRIVLGQQVVRRGVGAPIGSDRSTGCFRFLDVHFN